MEQTIDRERVLFLIYIYTNNEIAWQEIIWHYVLIELATNRSDPM